jgi:alpha-aminoadipate carrier protein LysW
MHMEVSCPNCDGVFEVGDVVVGEILDCPDCGISLKVMTIGDNLDLGIAAEEEEDWGQ